jgi:small subunit ribosomal protein S1
VEKNPWDELSSKYIPGSIIKGKVTNVTDFGIFVEIEEGIEGLVHISELSQKRVKSCSELYAVGDIVSAVVKSIDVKSKKIRLSIKDYESANDGYSVNQYINNKENIGSNLGKVMADVKNMDSES